MKRDDLSNRPSQTADRLFDYELILLTQRYLDERITEAMRIRRSHTNEHFGSYESLKEMGLDGDDERGHEFMDLIHKINARDARLEE